MVVAGCRFENWMSTGGIPSRSPRHAAALNGSTADNEEEFFLGWHSTCAMLPSTYIGVNRICEPGARAVNLNSALIQIQSAAELISMGFRGADRPRYWYSHGDFGWDTGHDEMRRWDKTWRTKCSWNQLLTIWERERVLPKNWLASFRREVIWIKARECLICFSRWQIT